MAIVSDAVNLGTTATDDSVAGKVFSPSTAGAQVSAAKISEQLSAGTSVTVDTHGAGDQPGAITVKKDAQIKKTAGGDATLTLKADKGIAFENRPFVTSESPDVAVVATAGKLNLNLLTGSGGQNGHIDIGDFVHFNLNGGDFHAGPANAASGKTSMSFSNAGTITAGNIILDTLGGTAGDFYNLIASGDLKVNGPLSIKGGFSLTSTLSAGHLLEIVAPSGDVRFFFLGLGTDDDKGKIAIEGNAGVNIQANGGHVVMGLLDRTKNATTVSSSEGSVNLGGKVQDGTNGLELSSVDISSAGNAKLDGLTYWGAAVKLFDVTLKAVGDVDITGATKELSTGNVGGAGSRGVTLTNSRLTSGGNVTLTGSSGSDPANENPGNALTIAGSTITTDSAAGKILLTGTTRSIVGVRMTDSTLSAASLEVNGIATDKGMGFSLENNTLKGGLADPKNVMLSAAGSAEGVTNLPAVETPVKPVEKEPATPSETPADPSSDKETTTPSDTPEVTPPVKDPDASSQTPVESLPVKDPATPSEAPEDVSSDKGPATPSDKPEDTSPAKDPDASSQTPVESLPVKDPATPSEAPEDVSSDKEPAAPSEKPADSSSDKETTTPSDKPEDTSPAKDPDASSETPAESLPVKDPAAPSEKPEDASSDKEPATPSETPADPSSDKETTTPSDTPEVTPPVKDPDASSQTPVESLPVKDPATPSEAPEDVSSDKEPATPSDKPEDTSPAKDPDASSQTPVESLPVKDPATPSEAPEDVSSDKEPAAPSEKPADSSSDKETTTPSDKPEDTSPAKDPDASSETPAESLPVKDPAAPSEKPEDASSDKEPATPSETPADPSSDKETTTPTDTPEVTPPVKDPDPSSETPVEPLPGKDPAAPSEKPEDASSDKEPARPSETPADPSSDKETTTPTDTPEVTPPVKDPDPSSETPVEPLPGKDPAAPSEKPGDTSSDKDPDTSLEKPADPVEKPADPVEKPADPVEKPADPVEKPADPVEKPVDPVEKPVDPVEKPVEPVKPAEPEKPIDEVRGPFPQLTAEEAKLVTSATVVTQGQSSANAQTSAQTQAPQSGFHVSGEPAVPASHYQMAAQEVDVSVCAGEECGAVKLDASKPSE